MNGLKRHTCAIKVSSKGYIENSIMNIFTKLGIKPPIRNLILNIPYVKNIMCRAKNIVINSISMKLISGTLNTKIQVFIQQIINN